MSDIDLNTFPKNRSEALAMLYLQSQDLSDKTPTQIHEMYWDAIFEIRKDYKHKCDVGYFKEL